ncbi:MAG: phytoene desaturase family protein [Micrococcus sp.]|nr:phytoene desaturase family protein [Micrococcus sp.]
MSAPPVPSESSDRADGTTSSARIVVIGAGFAGLATAGLLARQGHQVTVLEKSDQLGGRSGRFSAEGFTFDTGPSWYLMPEVIDGWFRLMGTSAAQELDLQTLDPGYRVYFEEHLDEAPVDVRAGRSHARELFERLEPGSGQRLDEYLDSAATIYELAKRHFLRTDFTRLWELAHPAVLRRIPQLARQLTGSLQDHVAARFTDTRLRQILGYPAVFLGTSPDRAPALYHLMSHLDLTDGVQYPTGGFAALVDAMERLVREAGVEIRTEAEVDAILVHEPDAGAAGGRPGRAADLRRSAAGLGRRLVGGLGRLTPAALHGVLPTAVPGEHGARQPGTVHGVRLRSGEQVSADVVVGAADLHHLQTALLPAPQRVAERVWTRRDPGPSGVLVCVGVRGALPQLEHHTLLFTADWDENFGRIHAGNALQERTSIYVSKTSATDAHVAPEGDEALFILVPAPARADWGRGGIVTSDVNEPGDPMVERVADAALDQIADWAGIEDLRERIVVRRTYGPGDFAANVHAWRGSMLGPGHTLGQSALFRPPVRDAVVDGLVYAGSSVRPGIGVPMCLLSAEIAAEAVQTQLRRRR